MNRRDPNSSSRQAGGYRNDDAGWDAPRQASQWQSDSEGQAGGGWAEEGRTQGTSARPTGRYADDRYGGEARRERDYRSGATAEESRYADRGYRFSGTGEGRFPAREFDASAGNDFTDFTADDYGGRDFSGNRGAFSGGLAPSDTYRPSYGIGSWSRDRNERDRSSRHGNEYDDWRGYGEQRGFLSRAGDEIASWFGDEDATRRREQDHRGRGPSDYTRSDDRIREDVNDALTQDWRVDASRVSVSVSDGEVTLTGTVDSRASKRRAEDLADDVTGVRHVQNNLRRQDASEVTAGTSTPGYSHTATSRTTTGGTDASS